MVELNNFGGCLVDFFSVWEIKFQDEDVISTQVDRCGVDLLLSKKVGFGSNMAGAPWWMKI